MRLMYIGSSGIRRVSTEDFAARSVEQEGFVIDVTKSREVEVSDEAAQMLLEAEPGKWAEADSLPPAGDSDLDVASGKLAHATDSVKAQGN